MKYDDQFNFSDYLILLVWFSEVVGLICLSLAPLIVAVYLAIEFTPLFMLLGLVYIPLLPLLIILWSKFAHSED